MQRRTHVTPFLGKLRHHGVCGLVALGSWIWHAIIDKLGKILV